MRLMLSSVLTASGRCQVQSTRAGPAMGEQSSGCRFTVNNRFSIVASIPEKQSPPSRTAHRSRGFTVHFGSFCGALKGGHGMRNTLGLLLCGISALIIVPAAAQQAGQNPNQAAGKALL